MICLALATPWLIGVFVPPAPMATPAPATQAALTGFVPRLPDDAAANQAVAAAQQGLRELLQARDSSAPAPVFDPAKIRVEHPATDVWLVSGVVSTAWQMQMAAPHLYRVEIYRICHLADRSCFKARGVAVDAQTLLDPGIPPSATP